MNRGTARRRLRLRRKRKDEGLASPLSTAGPPARAARDSGSVVADIAGDVAEQVVFRAGCCFLEAVLSAIALFALLSVPAYLLLHRVT